MINNPFADDGIIACQYCGSGEYLYNEDGNRNNFCGQCGHKIDWLDEGWFNTKDKLPDIPKNGFCSENVCAKYEDDLEIVAYMSFNGRWFDLDTNELEPPDCWRYLTEDEKNA